MQELLPLAHGDWCAEYKVRNAMRKRPDHPAEWNKRAKQYGLQHQHDHYIRDFLRLLQLEECLEAGESFEDLHILDIGSGPGTLSIPLARLGCTVHALDFAEGMIEELKIRAEQAGVSHKVIPYQLSWEDDWAAAGIPQLDIAFASRSSMVDDLGQALQKMSSFARRKLAMTVVTGISPKFDPVLARHFGRDIMWGLDTQYAFNILIQLGYFPRIDYIINDRIQGFNTKAEAYELARKQLGELDSADQQRLQAFMNEHLHRTQEGSVYAWEFDYVKRVSWSFISWTPDNSTMFSI